MEHSVGPQDSRSKKRCFSNATTTEGILYRWRVWRPPLNEDDPGKASPSENDLDAHLVGMWSGNYVFGKPMQNEIQVRPGDIPEQRGHYDEGAEFTGFVIVVVTVRKVYIWMLCSVSFNGDENGLEKSDQLP